MVRAIVLIVVFVALLAATAQYSDFKSLMAMVGIGASCFVLDWVTKKDRA